MGPLKAFGPLLVVCAALALGSACTEAPKPVPDAGLVINPDLHLAWQSGLPLLPRTSTVPAAWRQARLRWQTATTAFSIGAYEDAGRDFMAIADSLKSPGQPAMKDTLRTARCMAYENAGRAYRGVADPEIGLVVLAKARLHDPGCRHSLTLVLDRLTTGTATSAPPAPAAIAPVRTATATAP